MKRSEKLFAALALTLALFVCAGCTNMNEYSGLMAPLDFNANIGDSCEWAGGYAWQDALGNQNVYGNDAEWQCGSDTWRDGPTGIWHQNITKNALLTYTFTVTPDTLPDGAFLAQVATNITCAHAVTLTVIVEPGYQWDVYQDLSTYIKTDSDGDGTVSLTILDATGDAGLFNHSIMGIRGGQTSAPTTTATTGTATTTTTNQSSSTAQNPVDPWTTSSTTPGWGETEDHKLVLLMAVASAIAGTLTGGFGLFLRKRDAISYIEMGAAFMGAYVLTIGAKTWFDIDLTLGALSTGTVALVLRFVSAFAYALLIFVLLDAMVWAATKKNRGRR